MADYPFYDNQEQIKAKMSKGNFALWYNKFIPVVDFVSCKACDEKGNKDNAVGHYHNRYNQFMRDSTIQRLLNAKHINQKRFCDSFSARYEIIYVKAALRTPLITGIGETHPHEISMVFDHNLGVPYIPASSVKGIVRFAHTLGLIDQIPEGKLVEESDGKPCLPHFDDEDPWTNIPQLFGTQTKRGSVFFLDAYPQKVPDLHIDIMNPHYGEYYSDDNSQIPPADYLNPVPIIFLTVAKDTVFMFRALIDKQRADLLPTVRFALKRAFTEEGVGAKTAVGYGLFEYLKNEEAECVLEFTKKQELTKAEKEKEHRAKDEIERLAALTEDEKLIEEINLLINDSSQIASIVAKSLEGDFNMQTYIKLKEKLESLGEWKPSGSKQRKEKMRQRNIQIERKMTA